MLGTTCFAHHQGRRAARRANGFQSERPAYITGNGSGGCARSKTLARDAERRRGLRFLAARQRIMAIPEHPRGACPGPREAETVRRSERDVRQVAEVFARDRIAHSFLLWN